MAYNLLLDTQFQNSTWTFINCSYSKGKLISTNKVFGVYQELVLPDPTKLYFRCKYLVQDKDIKEIKIGIQNKNLLSIDKRLPKANKWQSISLIDYAKQEKIKVHIIFESNKDINEVYVKEPMLADLNHLHRTTWLKLVLDRVIVFMNGYSYTNQYKESLLTESNTDFKNCNIEKAKIGVIISEKQNKEIKIDAKFIVGKYYLAKLDFEEINQYGDIKLQYGVLKSTRNNDQLYLVFKAKENECLNLLIEPNEELAYQINLKHLMIVDITKLKLLKEDIPYLPFI